MATFKEQIEDLTGTIPDAVDGEQFLKDGIWDVIKRIEKIAPKMLPLFAVSSTWSDADGVNLVNNIVLDVTRKQINCRFIYNNLIAQVTDPTSIYYATPCDPVYYILNGVLHILPAPSDEPFAEEVPGVVSLVQAGAITTWDSGTSSIANFPDSMYRLPILFSAIRVLNEKIRGFLFETFNSTNVSPTEPTMNSISSSLPTITVPDTLNISSLVVSNSAIDFSEVRGAPNFISPTLSLTATPTITDLDLSSITVPFAPTIGDNTVDVSTLSTPTYTKPVLTLESLSAISDLSLSASAPTAITVGTNTVDVTDLVLPVYVAPILSLELLAAISDFTLGETAVVPEVPTALSATAISIGAVNANLTAAVPAFDNTVINAALALMVTHTDTNEDVELAMSKAKEIEIRLQNEIQEFNEAQAAYQGGLTIAVKDADIALQVAIQNSSLTLQKEIEEYKSLVQGFQVAVAAYQAIVNTELQTFIQNFQKDIAVYTSQNQIKMAEYTANIQNALHKFNQESVSYNSQLQYLIKNAELASTEEAQNVQNFAAAVQKYQAEVNAEVQVFVNNYQKNIGVYTSQNQIKLSEYTANIQSALNQFNQESTSYNSQLQYLIENTKLASAEDAQTLQSYSIDVQGYQAEVSSNVQEYNINEIQKKLSIWVNNTKNDLQQYMSDIQLESSRISSETTLFKQEIDKAIAVFSTENNTDISAYSAEAQTLIGQFQQNLARAAANFTKELEGYRLEQNTIATRNSELLNKYQIESGIYSSDLQKNLQLYSTGLQKNSLEMKAFESSYNKLKTEYEQGFVPFGQTQQAGRE